MPGFLVDENLPALLAEELVARGFRAEAVADNEALRSADDEELMEYAPRVGLAVISKDKDFANVRRYPLGSHVGIVCVRLRNRMAIDEQVAIVVAAVEALDPREIPGSLAIVEAGRVRLRRKND